MTEEKPWMTGYLDQVEAIAADLFQLEGERRTAAGQGREIFELLDSTRPEHLRMLIRMLLMTLDLEALEVTE